MLSRALVVLGVMVGAAACRPGLPSDADPSKDDDDPPVPDSDPPDTEDTDVDTPCDVTEVEPNDALADAGELPLEATACGTFARPEDGDYWSFTPDEEGWLRVDLSGYRLGSDAALMVVLASDDGVAVSVGSWLDLPEAHVALPVAPTGWTALVRQPVWDGSTPGSGDDYFYELRASSTKAPLAWDVEEAGGDSAAAPQVLVPEDAPGTRSVFGRIDGVGDHDWYAVEVPPGRYRVTFDVDAEEFGAAADLTLERADADGTVRQTVHSGVLGWEMDPVLVVHATEASVVRVAVSDDVRSSGAAAWYVLRATVEAE